MTLALAMLPRESPAHARRPGPGQPPASESPRLRRRNLGWLLAALDGLTPRQIAEDPALSGGMTLRTIQRGIKVARQARRPRRSAS